MDRQDDKKKQIIKLLLDTYAESSFKSLREIRDLFSMPKFAQIGFTPLKVIERIFGGKEKYFEMLNELENKLYEC